MMKDNFQRSGGGTHTGGAPRFRHKELRDKKNAGTGKTLKNLGPEKEGEGCACGGNSKKEKKGGLRTGGN